jgi:hypothetical protein
MKLLFVITFLLSCNFLSQLFFDKSLRFKYKGKELGWFYLIMILSMIYQTYYWFTKFNII